MSALREVLAVFDIIVNDAQLEASNKKLDSFVDKLKGIGTAFAGFKVVQSIMNFGEHVAEAAREAEFGAARIGMTAPEYQKLSQVAENYGVKVEQLQISTRMLIRGLSDAHGTMGTFSSRTHFARDALHNLNIDATQFRGKKLDEILPVLADGFKNVEDPVERTAIALRLFGHRGLSILPMMAAGGAELRRQFAAAVPVFEEATITSANEATIAGKQLSRTWDNLVNNSFGRAVLDTFTVVAKKLTDIVLAVKELTKNSEIGKGIVVSLGVALATAAVMIIAAWWPVLLPILAVMAAFAALALIVDDFIVFMQGGHSVIGRFFNELLGEGGADRARDVIKGMWEDFKGFLAELKGEAFKEFLSGAKALVADIRDKIQDIKDAIAWIESHWIKLREGLDKFAHFFGGGTSDIRATTTVAGALASPNFVSNVAPPPEIGPPTAAQAAVYGGGAPGPGGTMVNIHGGVDSAELARKVQHTVDSHYEQVQGLLFRDAAAAAGAK
jgi:hypothetical protein